MQLVPAATHTLAAATRWPAPQPMAQPLPISVEFEPAPLPHYLRSSGWKAGSMVAPDRLPPPVDPMAALLQRNPHIMEGSVGVLAALVARHPPRREVLKQAVEPFAKHVLEGKPLFEPLPDGVLPATPGFAPDSFGRWRLGSPPPGTAGALKPAHVTPPPPPFTLEH